MTELAVVGFESFTLSPVIVLDAGVTVTSSVDDTRVGPLVTIEVSGGGAGTLTRKTTADGSIVILDTATGEEFPI